MTDAGTLIKNRVSFFTRIRKEGLIVDPQGQFRTWWDLVSMLLIFWIALFVPFRLAFDLGEQCALNIIDLIIDIFFIVDVGINMVTAYYDDGHLVIAHKQILIHYIKTYASVHTSQLHTPHLTHLSSSLSVNSWMAFDVLSSFPSIGSSSSHHHYAAPSRCQTMPRPPTFPS